MKGPDGRGEDRWSASATQATAILALAAIVGLAGCATAPPIPRDGSLVPPLEDRANVRDLRGAFRAALCANPAMSQERCEQSIQRLAGERRAERPSAADPGSVRIVFVPGFLSGCFPSFNPFADVIHSLSADGFDVRRLEIGGRAAIADNATRLALQIEAMPDDDRPIVAIAHSKGALEVLELLVRRPDLAPRFVALLGVSGAFGGSPLAASLGDVYAFALATNPLLRCDGGDREALADLTPSARRAWWDAHATQVPVPVYSLVALPDGARVSPLLRWSHDRLLAIGGPNDGQLLARDQVAPRGVLLGYVNADHLGIAIPRPERLPWTLVLGSAEIPRAPLVRAALDVICADLGLPTEVHRDFAAARNADR